jgi:hypothetical protein
VSYMLLAGWALEHPPPHTHTPPPRRPPSWLRELSSSPYHLHLYDEAC